MSLNTLTFATNMASELDKAVSQASVTGFLADNTLRAKFIGANTVMIPEMSTSGLGDYDRDNGFVNGSIAVSSATCTLSMDRGRSFQLDREDNDETGIAGLAGQVMGEFVRTRVVPEVDAFCLSKMAAYAIAQEHTVTGTPATQAYSMFMKAVAKARDEVGYDEPLVAFVNSQMWWALQESSELSRQMILTDFAKGELNMQVNSINGVAILPVPDSRMKSAFTFYDGETEGETDGGFAPTDSALEIGLLIVPKHAASLIKKTDQIRAFDPSQNLNADAWKFDYRLYYDLFLKNSLKDGMIVYAYSASDEEDDLTEEEN